MHPSERASLTRSETWRKLGKPLNAPVSLEGDAAGEVEALGVGLAIQSGSIEEERALLAIEEKRSEDRAKLADTFEARQKRARRGWSRARGTT